MYETEFESTKTPPGAPTKSATLRQASYLLLMSLYKYRDVSYRTGYAATQAIRFSSILKPRKLEMFTMFATLRETSKHSDWPSQAKIAPHLHKVEKISPLSRRYPQCTTQAIRQAPLKMNGEHVVASLASLQCERTVRVKDAMVWDVPYFAVFSNQFFLFRQTDHRKSGLYVVCNGHHFEAGLHFEPSKNRLGRGYRDQQDKQNPLTAIALSFYNSYFS